MSQVSASFPATSRPTRPRHVGSRRFITRSLLLAASAVGSPACEERPEPPDGDQLRIVDGLETNAFPAVGMVLTSDRVGGLVEGSISGNCSGTLITPRVVLTAAHCLESSYLGFAIAEVGVYFGTTYWEASSDFVASVLAVDYVVHPGWDGGAPADAWEHDLALVFLGEDIAAAPIPYRREPLTPELLGVPVASVGWGNTDGDQNDWGVKRIRETTLADYDAVHLMTGPDPDTCAGDSGGPAIISPDGLDVVVGVTSAGDLACAYPGHHARVDIDVAWIDEQIGVDTDPQPACTSDADCPAGWRCTSVGGTAQCIPDDAGDDSDDSDDSDDGSSDEGGDEPDDDDDESSQATTGTAGSPPVQFRGNGDSQGCSVPHRPNANWALLVGVLGLLVVRRRRTGSVHAGR